MHYRKEVEAIKVVEVACPHCNRRELAVIPADKKLEGVRREARATISRPDIQACKGCGGSFYVQLR